MDFWWFLYAVKWSLGAASSMNATVPGQNWIMGFFRNGPYLLGKSRVVRWSCSGTLGAPSPAQLSTLVEIRHGAGKSSDFGCFFLTLSNFGGRSILFCLLWGSGGRVRSSAALLRGGPKSACKSGHLGRFETSRVVVALCDIATCFKNMSK